MLKLGAYTWQARSQPAVVADPTDAENPFPREATSRLPAIRDVSHFLRIESAPHMLELLYTIYRPILAARLARLTPLSGSLHVAQVMARLDALYNGGSFDAHVVAAIFEHASTLALFTRVFSGRSLWQFWFASLALLSASCDVRVPPLLQLLTHTAQSTWNLRNALARIEHQTVLDAFEFQDEQCDAWPRAHPSPCFLADTDGSWLLQMRTGEMYWVTLCMDLVSGCAVDPMFERMVSDYALTEHIQRHPLAGCRWEPLLEELEDDDESSSSSDESDSE